MQSVSWAWRRVAVRQASASIQTNGDPNFVLLRAACKDRMELIDGRELKALVLEHLDLDVLIGLDRPLWGWQRRDIT